MRTFSSTEQPFEPHKEAKNGKRAERRDAKYECLTSREQARVGYALFFGVLTAVLIDSYMAKYEYIPNHCHEQQSILL